MNPHALETLYHRLGQPAWFWPLVLGFLFVVLPSLASALQAVAP